MSLADEEEIPKQVKIRTDPDDGYAYRYDAIESASLYWGRNKTDSIVWSCEVVGKLVPAIEEALEHDDLPPRIAQNIANAISTRNLKVTITNRSVSIEPK